jgi:peroxiredoxin Q/BCP
MRALGTGLALLAGAGLLLAARARRGRLLPVGASAPPFVLPDQDGRQVRTVDLAGTWWLLYFYPRDQTPGCTREACALRDQMTDLKTLGVRVVGMSRDGVAAHRAFADRHGLGFDLLADPGGGVVAAYGARSALPGVARRVSYLVDPAGRIRKVYPKVSPARHADQVLADVRALQAPGGVAERD